MMKVDSTLHNNHARIQNREGSGGEESRHEGKSSEERETPTTNAQKSEYG